MNEADRKSFEKYYELFYNNVHKGESYKIKFKNDGVEYIGIPMAGPAVMTGDESIFLFDITEPVEKKGVFKKLFRMIDYIQKI